MLGVIKAILGSGDVIGKGMQLIDDMHTSKEEEIEAKNKAKVALLDAYAPFKLAQRVLAFAFTGVFVFSFFLVLGMTLFGNIGEAGISDVMAVLAMFYIGEIMLTIVVFYFGGGLAEGVVNRMKQPKQLPVPA